MKNEKRGRIEDYKSAIEDFYEQYNGPIQIILVLMTVIATCLFGIAYSKIEGIIVTLLSLACAELLSLSLKDSIQQKKLNRILRRGEIEDGKLFRVADFDLHDFFHKTQEVFFVSGIALNWFFDTYKRDISQLLKDGKKVCVLFCDYENFTDQAKLYFGSTTDSHEGSSSVIAGLQHCAIQKIKGIKDIEDYINEGNFEIRLSNTTFSTSFVAYDIWTSKKEKPIISKVESEIKASFYLYALDKAEKKNPNVLVDNKYGREWYGLFRESLTNQWKDAKRVGSLDELNRIEEEVRKLK